MEKSKESGPLLDEGMEKWIVGQAYRRAWQIPEYEVEDLISEGYFCYAKCLEKYGHNFSAVPTKDERRWFMALVKRTFSNHLTSLQRKACRKPIHVGLVGHVPDEGEPLYSSVNRGQRDLEDGRNVDFGLQGFVDIMLSAPTEVMQVFQKLVEDGHVALTAVTREASRLSLSETRKVKRLRYRETTNEQLCRLVGCDPNKKNIHRDILNLLEKS